MPRALKVPVCVVKERRGAADAFSRPGREHVVPPAAGLRRHRLPRRPSGSHQLHLQVAAARPQRKLPLCLTQHTHIPEFFRRADLQLTHSLRLTNPYLCVLEKQKNSERDRF